MTAPSSSTVDTVGAIEARLAELRCRPDGVDAETGFVRARTLNLVVYAETAEVARQAEATLASLAQTFPSRAVLVIPGEEQAEPGISAAVSTECHRVRDRLVCYEQISIHTRGGSSRHVLGVVEPLLVSHLPVCLWWLADPSFSHDAFRQLASISQRIILDSRGFRELPRDFAELQRLVQTGTHIVDDLTWQRLLPWRQVMAQLFPGEEGTRHLAAVERVRVECGQRQRAEAVLLLAWLAAALRWDTEGGVRCPDTTGARDISVLVEPTTAEDGLRSVEIATGPQEASDRFVLSRDGPEMVARIRGSSVTEVSRRSHVQWPDDCDLIQTGLALRGGDPVFEQALAHAENLSVIAA